MMIELTPDKSASNRNDDFHVKNDWRATVHIYPKTTPKDDERSMKDIKNDLLSLVPYVSTYMGKYIVWNI